MSNCLVKDCGRPRKRRGLCLKCYMRYYERIARGVTTWEELETQGVSSPATGKRGTRSRSAMGRQIEEFLKRI